MKIRTITTGFNLQSPLEEKQIKQFCEFTNTAREIFANNGYTVQTARVATQPWKEYFESKNQMIELVKEFEKLVNKYSVDYFNIGTTFDPQLIPLIYDMIQNTSTMFCTTFISDSITINYEVAQHTAQVMKRLSTIQEDGFANLRFAGIFNTKPGSPFYPAAYHKGPPSFAIGTENSDLVYQAFSEAKTIEKAATFLENILLEEFKKIETIAKQISAKEKIHYDGIDVSIAPSINRNESIAYAFEKLGLGTFGDVGTLAIARVVTQTIQNLNIKKCGYSGLMLPVLEDYGLAQRNTEETYNLTDLLLYSSVCGTGLDTIPLPGDVSEEKLYALLLDIASLAIKLNKPLSARLMPIPHKKAGEMTDYTFEYFVNSKIMKI